MNFGLKSTMKKTLFLALMLAAGAQPVRAQSTAFTFQGQLFNNAKPAANGLYDLQFALFDADTGGTALAEPLTRTATPLTNGLFTVQLDYGAGPFDLSARWVEVAVRTNGVGSYVTLNPRQQLLPAPYALAASTANNLSGTLPATQLRGTVGNHQLANHEVTVITGAGLSGGGAVPLGGSLTLANAGVISVTGNADITATATGGNVVLGTTATDANTAGAIVKRDSGGSFSGSTLNLSGNLNLPATTGSGAGVIHFDGTPCSRPAEIATCSWAKTRATSR